MIGATLAGRYQVMRVLGTGGMGAVYEAKHTTTGKRVAVKILASHLSKDLKLVARFRREAMAASRLDHENCVQIDDFGEDGEGTFYIAMELIDGHGLGDELRKSGPMPPGRVARIGVQLLKALDAAHVGGVLHRDLKPQNVMLSSKASKPDLVKVVDFGIAKITSNDPSDQQALTIPGTIFGTPEYMSPEQARGEVLDARSDLYSASVVLWHMLLGRSPFRGTSVRETLMKVFSDDAPSPMAERPGLALPPGFEDVLRRGLAKQREHRWSDAASYAAALAPFASGPPIDLPPRQRPGLSTDGSPPPPTLDKVPVVSGKRDTMPLPPAQQPAHRSGRGNTNPPTAVASPPPSISSPSMVPPTAVMSGTQLEMNGTPPPPPMRAPARPATAAPPPVPAGPPKGTPKVLTVAALERVTTAAPKPVVVTPSVRVVPRISPAALIVIIGGVVLLVGFAVVVTLILSGRLAMPQQQPPRGPVVGAPAPPALPPPSPSASTSALQKILEGDLPLDPLARDAALGRAERAVEASDFGAARTAYEEALAADPTAPSVLSGLGTIAMRQRDWAVARDCFGKLIALDNAYRKQFGPLYARAKAMADKAP